MAAFILGGTMFRSKEFFVLGLFLCAGLSTVPATATPVRVIIFNTCGPGGYIFPIAQQTPLLKQMLLNPAGADLQMPIIPADGFTVDSLGSATHNGDTSDGHSLIQALATHDVVVCINNSNFSGLFNSKDRIAFLTWAKQKGHGVVATHGALMDNGSWLEKDQYFGGVFTEWTSGTAQVLEDTTPGNSKDPDFLALNAGLEKTNLVADIWMSFATGSRTLLVGDTWVSYLLQTRALPGIHVLATLNEASYHPSDRMGDHPIAWYRAPADSGRFFYTAAGHNWIPYRDSYWLRRQLYNGILWASGRTGAIPVSLKPDARMGSDANPENVSRGISRSRFTVFIYRDGSRLLEAVGLDGKIRRATGAP
jgi:type 1 glutamine amidotransferase